MKHLPSHPIHLLAAPLGLTFGIALATSCIFLAIRHLNLGNPADAFGYFTLFLLTLPLIAGAGVLSSCFSYFATRRILPSHPRPKTPINTSKPPA